MEHQLAILIEVFGAGILGGFIGFEREMSSKPAGLRTYMLIAITACLLVNLGSVLIDVYEQGQAASQIQADPIRIIEAVVVGISFIGGGLIIKYKETGAVANLTTAALTLFTAAIGICVALEQYLLAVSLTGFSLLISTVLVKFEKEVPKKS